MSAWDWALLKSTKTGARRLSVCLPACLPVQRCHATNHPSPRRKIILRLLTNSMVVVAGSIDLLSSFAGSAGESRNKYEMQFDWLLVFNREKLSAAEKNTRPRKKMPPRASLDWVKISLFFLLNMKPYPTFIAGKILFAGKGDRRSEGKGLRETHSTKAHSSS